MGRTILLGLLLGCGWATAISQRPDADTSLVFLTRNGCVNTAAMRAHLDDALRSLGRPVAYQVIDANTLPAADSRRAYGTPTVLIGNRDLFGMPEQKTLDPPT